MPGKLVPFTFIILLFQLFCFKVFAQPPNDDPCNATQLTVAGSCTYQSYTLVNATASLGVPAPGCANYQGADVWFKVTVPCGGLLDIDTQTGSIFNGGMAIYSGDCTNLSLITCDDNSSANGQMAEIISTGLTSGSTIWIRVWSYGNAQSGTFGICVTVPLPPPPGSTCPTAGSFCTGSVYNFHNSTGVPSLGSGGIYGCLGSTPNPVFYFMQIATAGNLDIHITQVSTGGSGIDVDFACWGPFADPSVMCSNISATNIVSCSFSGAADETCIITNAQVGEYYLLLLTNFSGLPGSITFQQSGGTASTNCGIVCNVTAGNSGPICGGVFNLTSNAPGAAPGTTYSWTGPNCFTSNQQNPTNVPAPATAGSYIYTVTATTPTGGICTATTTLVVGTLGGSTALPAAPSCPGTNDGSITITPPATGGPFTYTLNLGLPSAVNNGNNPVFTNLTPGNYTVTVAVVSGCSQTLNVVVLASTGVTPTASTTSTSCPTVNNGTITVAPPATGGPFVYTLNAGLPTEVIQNNNPVFTNLPAGTYTIAVATSTGCSGTVSPNPVVNPGAALTHNAPTISNPPCSNINDGIITIVPSIAGVYTYILNPGLPGQVNNGNNPTFTNLAAGNYTYSFTNAIGCVGTGDTTLTTHSPLTTIISFTKPLCNGNANGIITLNASGGVSPYQYALSPFAVYQGGTFNNLIAGTYTFRIKDDVGCTKDTTVTLLQPALLTADADSTNGTCNGNDGQITVTASGGTPVYTYSIDNGVTYQTSANFIVSGGNYPNIRVQDNNGCIANTSTIVLVVDNMTLIPIHDTTICAGQVVPFQPQMSAQANHFVWTTIPYPSWVNTLSSDTIKNPIATPLDTTTYIFNATWGICSRADTVTIRVLHKPIVYAGRDTTVCFDRTTALLHGIATNLSGTVNYLWTDTTNLQTPHNNITVATPTATQSYTLTVTDNYGCNFTVPDDITVFVNPPVPAFAGNDTIAALGQPHQLFASGGVDFLWSPAYPLNLSTIQNPLATLDHDQEFTVVVTDAYGCVQADKVFIQVYQGPAYYIPNAFSPNGDGKNDIFRVIPPGISYTEWFRIFNRFGELVFETNKWLKGWDGTYKGKKQPVGNYIWMIKGIDKYGKVIEMKGSVMIVQ